jgi:hypothetical protein
MVIEPADSVQDAALFVLHAASLPTTSGIVIQIFPPQGGSVLEYAHCVGEVEPLLVVRSHDTCRLAVPILQSGPMPQIRQVSHFDSFSSLFGDRHDVDANILFDRRLFCRR